MDNMYIKIEEGQVTNITNNKDRDNVIHFGVKYFLGHDHVVFNVKEEVLSVSRYRENILLYTYEFMNEGEYMITPLFVDIYKSSHPMTRELYSYLKSNYHDKFYLEEDLQMDRGYKIIFSSWVDRKFCYKYTIVINPQQITEKDILGVKYRLNVMENMNLLNLHNFTKGKSIFVTDGALETIISMESELVAGITG